MKIVGLEKTEEEHRRNFWMGEKNTATTNGCCERLCVCVSKKQFSLSFSFLYHGKYIYQNIYIF